MDTKNTGHSRCFLQEQGKRQVFQMKNVNYSAKKYLWIGTVLSVIDHSAKLLAYPVSSGIWVSRDSL